MIKLTARQEEILNLIKEAIENTGFPPTRAEIAAELGFKSANAAEEHLKALQRKGAIEITAGTSRGIRLTGNFGGTATGTGAAIASTGAPAARGAARAKVEFDDMPAVPAGMLVSLPLIGRVAAGSPILAQENLETTYSVDPKLFSAKPDFLLKVRGESMRDIGIMDGDLLAVKKTDTARNGQVVVARIGNDVTVKTYRKTGSTIELLPENPDFKVITVTPEDDFALEGLAVGLMRTWH
ncbi:transcriptional repressor LexA [Pseudoduganella sp. OTU4001]|uniref:transcriptional repressor LexA n=1 Tax=Pseudoduganella sp. OTU4001 TaxID=3043854 RepID=UPI00313AFC01